MSKPTVIDTKFRIPRLSFYWRVRESLQDKNIVPDFLPLGLAYDKKHGLFRQTRNARVLHHLSTIYQEVPNIGHNQEQSNWKSLYGGDLVEFIAEEIQGGNSHVQKVLEIGCGGCVVLEQFKKRGFEVLGIDPSPFARIEGKKKGIRVIQDFFPSKHIGGKFDLIYHSNVLEHISTPVSFLKSQFNHLVPGGMLMFAVPDCTGPLKNGDISIFYHQHLLFFDTDSLTSVVRQAGFEVIEVRTAGYGGNLYCIARKPAGKRRAKFQPTAMDKSKLFLQRHKLLLGEFQQYFRKVLSDPNRTLGIYAPLRVLPYLAKMNHYSGFRFLDDTSYWHRRYFDGIDVPIENFEDLTRNPVTDILIMSPTFGEVIENKIKNHFGSAIRIKKITDFYRYR